MWRSQYFFALLPCILKTSDFATSRIGIKCQLYTCLRRIYIYKYFVFGAATNPHHFLQFSLTMDFPMINLIEDIIQGIHSAAIARAGAPLPPFSSKGKAII